MSDNGSSLFHELMTDVKDLADYNMEDKECKCAVCRGVITLGCGMVVIFEKCNVHMHGECYDDVLDTIEVK